MRVTILPRDRLSHHRAARDAPLPPLHLRPPRLHRTALPRVRLPVHVGRAQRSDAPPPSLSFRSPAQPSIPRVLPHAPRRPVAAPLLAKPLPDTALQRPPPHALLRS